MGQDPSILQVLGQILEHPHRELVLDTPLVELEGLTEPETERFLELIADPGSLSPTNEEPVHFNYEGLDYQFTKVYDARPRITFDTYPNRFVRHVLLRLRDLLTHPTQAPDPQAQKLARRIDGLIQSSVLASCSPLHHISAEHNVLRKDPNYREVLRLSVEMTHRIHDAGEKSAG